MSKTKTKEIQISAEFKKIIDDFTNDILSTFPEYTPIIQSWGKGKGNGNDEDNDKEAIYSYLFQHCQKVYPPHFFNILYKNDILFQQYADFLPGINFQDIWNCPQISENSRNTIWQYLQIILFSIIGTIEDKSVFGDETANLFSAISPDDMQSKIKDVMGEMQSLFEHLGQTNKTDTSDTGNEQEQEQNDGPSSIPSMPNPEDIQNHLNELMGGKIGQFAMEIASEWATELDIDLQTETDNANIEDVFQKLVKNPMKMFDLIKKVGERFQEKIQSGEMTREEVLKEAKELLEKMKGMNIPGMDKMQDLLAGFTQGKGRGKGRGNANAAANANIQGLKKQMEFEQMKEKLRLSKERLDKKKTKQQSSIHITQEPLYSDKEILALFDTPSVKSSKKTKK